MISAASITPTDPLALSSAPGARPWTAYRRVRGDQYDFVRRECAGQYAHDIAVGTTAVGPVVITGGQALPLQVFKDELRGLLQRHTGAGIARGDGVRYTADERGHFAAQCAS